MLSKIVGVNVPASMQKKEALFLVRAFDLLDEAFMQVTGKSKENDAVIQFTNAAFNADGGREFSCKITKTMLDETLQIIEELYDWLYAVPCTYDETPTLSHKYSCIVCKTKKYLRELEEDNTPNFGNDYY